MFVFVLPVLKFVMQNIVVWSTKHIVEYMPGVTVFSVEVFTALYMAKCIQSAGSMTTFAAIMAFDALESVLAYRDIKTRTAQLNQFMKQYNATNSDKRFVDTIMAECQEPDVLSRKDSNIRIRSPIKLSVSRKTIILHDELVRTQSTALEEREARSSEVENDKACEATSPGMVAPIVSDPEFDKLVLADKSVMKDVTGSASIEINTTEQEPVSNVDNTPAPPLKPQSVKPTVTDDEPSEIYPEEITVEYPKQMDSESNIQEAGNEQAISSPQKRQSLAAVTPYATGDADTSLSPQYTSDTESQIQDGSNESSQMVVEPVGSALPTKESDEPVQILPSQTTLGDENNARIESLVNGLELLQPMMMNATLDLNNVKHSRLTSNIKPGLSSDEKVHFVNDSLKILFHCEYHALVEYVEAMIPMLYCIYVAILTQLPSRMYYPETRNMTTAHVEKMVINIFTYAWLEVLSFIAMNYTIKWRFVFSPAYLLAFVLENQAMEFQAHLLVWFTYVLEITLVHYGVDLTLKFAWLKGDWMGMS